MSATANAQPPIVMLSSGRAGSTLLHEIAAHHPQVAWLPARWDPAASGYLRRARAVARCARGVALGRACVRAFPPGEVYELWERLVSGFAEPGRDLLGDDATPEHIHAVRAAVASVTNSARSRLLVKVTGFPRLGFLNACLPEARFVHVLRDPRPVALSFLRVPWWRGAQGPDAWRWGPLSAEDTALWERHDRSLLALACIQMGIYWRALLAALEHVDAPPLYHVRYDDLCARPVEVWHGLQDHCGLEPSRAFDRWLRRRRFEDRGAEWRARTSPADQAVLDEILQPWVEVAERISAGDRP